MFSMMTVEDTAKPSKSRRSVAVLPQESFRPATTRRPGATNLPCSSATAPRSSGAVSESRVRSASATKSRAADLILIPSAASSLWPQSARGKRERQRQIDEGCLANRFGFDALHVGIRQAEMVADFVHQDMGDYGAERFLVLGPIVENRAPVEEHHVGHRGDV